MSRRDHLPLRPGISRFRIWIGSAAVAGIAGLVLLAAGPLDGPPPAATGPDSVEDTRATAPSGIERLDAAIDDAQARLRELPGDYTTWTALGSSYVDKARLTEDPSFYAEAEKALDRSLSVGPAENPVALAGLGALANARHDFGAARELALQALALNPYDANAFGVLADAETQLGNAAAATQAVQRMLDLSPRLPALARASYDRELHGRTDEARDLMGRALATAIDPVDVAFCRHALGDLALHGGDLDTAETQFTAAAAADPAFLPAREGLAEVAAARGDIDASLAGFAELTSVAPTVDHLLGYADVLRAAGRGEEAQAQLAAAAAAHETFLAAGGQDLLAGAELAIAQGRPADALRLARQEWQRRQFADVADTLAWALHLSGRDAEARGYAVRAGSLGAANADYAFHRGMIELSLGESAAAREHLTRALDINPYFSPVDAPVAARTLAELEAG